MYSKARIAGHPIHPMLIAFPVALYVATVVGLFVFLGTNDPFWFRAAFWANVAGVVMAAVAAVPGLIDLFFAIPQRTKARRTGYEHAGLNVLSLVLFTICAYLIGRAWYGRHLIEGRYALDATAPLVVGIFGCLSTVVAGWLGWKLVQTHHVGIKPTERVAPEAPVENIDDLDALVMPPPPAEPVRRIEVRH